MKLTLRDKHILREMLSLACSYRCGDPVKVRTFERVMAKIVPRGALPKLRNSR